jgi:S1-C subfamily serine protease
MKQEPWRVTGLLLLGTLLIICCPLSAYSAHPMGSHFIPKTRLGVIVRDLPFEGLANLNLEYGVKVVRVAPVSPAKEAGLQAGDIIIELDDKPVYSVRRLNWLVSKLPASQDISLSYNRSGNTKRVKVQLQSFEVRLPRFQFFERGWPPLSTSLGVNLQAMTDELRRHFGAPDGVGVLIVEVLDGSAADEAGLVAGDVITKMDRKMIYHVADVYRVLNFFDPGEELAVEIIREKKSKTVNVELAQPPFPSYRGWALPYEAPSELFDPRYWQQGLDEMLEKWKEFWQERRDYYIEKSPNYL